MKESKPKYMTVPIGLLRKIHTAPTGTIKEMFDYGIYDRMRKNNPDYEHDDFQEPAIEESLQYFKLKPNNLEQRLKDGKTLYDTFEGTPNASVNKDILLAYQKEKTEFELVVFSFYCAIRSMIGTKPYFKGTDEFWITRAFGYSSKEDYQNAKPTQGEKDMRAKYSKRYWLDKIKLTLQNDWNLVYLSTNKHIKIRGFYVSLQMDYEQIALIAKGKNEKSKSKQLLREQTLSRVFG